MGGVEDGVIGAPSSGALGGAVVGTAPYRGQAVVRAPARPSGVAGRRWAIGTRAGDTCIAWRVDTWTPGVMTTAPERGPTSRTGASGAGAASAAALGREPDPGPIDRIT